MHSKIRNKYRDFDVEMTQIVQQGKTWTAFWIAKTRLKADPYPIGKEFIYEGLSVLTFNRQNKIVKHRDYFDQFALYNIIPGFKETADSLLQDYISEQIPMP